jgi:hypothetical protein
MPIQSANPTEKIHLFNWTQGGVNQSSDRSVIDDQDTFWCENLFPIAPGELRSAWGPSAPIYTAPSGTTILRMFFAPLNDNQYGYMFLSNGNVDQVDVNAGTVTTIPSVWQPVAPNYWADLKLFVPTQVAGPGAIGSPGGVAIGSPLGYFAWDGSTLTSPGQTPPLWLSGGATTDAAGQPLVMPSGLPGIYMMEVYLERMFVGGQTVISMSGSTNAADFSASGGGGSWGYTGDQLTVSYTDMVASNGWLYVFGDSMTNYVSGLQLVGAVTAIGTIYTSQFNYANINPQIGHRYFRPVALWLESVVVFDGAGIFLLSQQTYVWLSAKLTNLIRTVQSDSFQPTMTTCHIFGQRWLIINGEFQDPLTHQYRSMLLCWNGQIWTIASQNLNLTHIGSYEQNSCITPFGTDGTSLYRLFDHPDPLLSKKICTKAYQGPNPLTIKDWKRVYVQLHDKMIPPTWSGDAVPPSPEGVYITGTFTSHGGELPNGSESVSFSCKPGNWDTVGHPTVGKGITAWLDLESNSPDFTISRISLSYDERAEYGA